MRIGPIEILPVHDRTGREIAREVPVRTRKPPRAKGTAQSSSTWDQLRIGPSRMLRAVPDESSVGAALPSPGTAGELMMVRKTKPTGSA
jgi:hypothetical protein